jgi:hypothetical protein
MPTIKNSTPKRPISDLRCSTAFIGKKRTRVRFHAVNARKEKSRKTKQFFSDDYHDNEKTHGGNGNYSRRREKTARRENPSVVYDARRDLSEKNERESDFAPWMLKREIKET